MCFMYIYMTCAAIIKLTHKNGFCTGKNEISWIETYQSTKTIFIYLAELNAS